MWLQIDPTALQTVPSAGPPQPPHCANHLCEFDNACADGRLGGLRVAEQERGWAGGVHPVVPRVRSGGALLRRGWSARRRSRLAARLRAGRRRRPRLGSRGASRRWWRQACRAAAGNGFASGAGGGRSRASSGARSSTSSRCATGGSCASTMQLGGDWKRTRGQQASGAAALRHGRADRRGVAAGAR
jgi:hypothetical protein